MTVKELIEELQKLPEGKDVAVYDHKTQDVAGEVTSVDADNFCVLVFLNINRGRDDRKRID